METREDQIEPSVDQMDYWEAYAALAWQVELGVDEAIHETPINRFEIPEKAPAPVAAKSAERSKAAPQSARQNPPRRTLPPKEPSVDAVEEAALAAQTASSLDSLREAMAGFEHCALRKGARNLVFCDGNPKAKVMIIGEAPGREEDKKGLPFVGRTGQLLDDMFAAIGLSRMGQTPQDSIYITTALPWRPPENRDPTPDEIAMMKPFLLKHIELVDPEILVLVGNWACTALLGRSGITRLRGKWVDVMGKPTMPMTHPDYLLRQPLAKRDAWADLLSIKARLAPTQ